MASKTESKSEARVKDLEEQVATLEGHVQQLVQELTQSRSYEVAARRELDNYRMQELQSLRQMQQYVSTVEEAAPEPGSRNGDGR